MKKNAINRTTYNRVDKHATWNSNACINFGNISSLYEDDIQIKYPYSNMKSK